MRNTWQRALLASGFVAGAAHAGITTLVLDTNIDGMVSTGAIGAAGNSVIELDLNALLPGYATGVPHILTSLGWDVTIETAGASLLSQAAIYFDDNLSPDGLGVQLRPGFQHPTPGVMRFVSDGMLDLSDKAISNVVLPNGILRLEFFDTLDDDPGAVDAYWSGTVLTGLQGPIPPSPGGVAVFGVAGLAALRRRR